MDFQGQVFLNTGKGGNGSNSSSFGRTSTDGCPCVVVVLLDNSLLLCAKGQGTQEVSVLHVRKKAARANSKKRIKKHGNATSSSR